MYRQPIDSTKRNVSHFFMCIDISRFLPLESFKESLQETVNRIRTAKPLEGTARVMVAGDPEKQKFAERVKSGIPILDEKLDEFLAMSQEYRGALMP